MHWRQPTACCINPQYMYVSSCARRLAQLLYCDHWRQANGNARLLTLYPGHHIDPHTSGMRRARRLAQVLRCVRRRHAGGDGPAGGPRHAPRRRPRRRPGAAAVLLRRLLPLPAGNQHEDRRPPHVPAHAPPPEAGLPGASLPSACVLPGIFANAQSQGTFKLGSHSPLRLHDCSAWSSTDSIIGTMLHRNRHVGLIGDALLRSIVADHPLMRASIAFCAVL